MIATSVIIAATLAWIPSDPPIVIVDRDNIQIDQSCIIEIRGDVIADGDNNGVIHIVADDVTIEFSEDHRELMGAPEGTPWDEISGIGLRIDGHDNITIRGAHLHRYKVGLYATGADHLTIERCDVAGGFAQRLRSTPQAEDGADWLWPHRNDNNEWLHNYGAGIYIEDSKDVTVRECFARRRQNGIILDRVESAKIYDNDCSFLSGWGLALWRSSHNFITRNSFDFCIRGYSHGVYNRGQDSAGILLFEQCSDNLIAENSATHGGDGFFAFAGRDALGEAWLEDEHARLRGQGINPEEATIRYPADLLRRLFRTGNNRNLILNNDFSYAAAHGIELTFSFDNQIVGNRLAENAICGIWGGYSHDTLIAGNDFDSNGEMGYGLERGGVNIEHGSGNLITDNGFRNNKCGIHLWWDVDNHLFRLAWTKANDLNIARNADGSVDHSALASSDMRTMPSVNNIIAGNTFDGDAVAIHLRDADATFISANEFREVGEEIVPENSEVRRNLEKIPWRVPRYPALGSKQPVGARRELAGRDRIIVTEWFPYDWREPYLHRVEDDDGAHVYRLLGDENVKGMGIVPDELPPHWKSGLGAGLRPDRRTIVVQSSSAGLVIPYTLAVGTESGAELERSDVLITSQWDVTVFSSGDIDPREAPDQWRRLAESGISFELPSLDLPYGGHGPSELSLAPAHLREAQISDNHFGTIAHVTLTFPKGRWRITTASDDGVRVTANGEMIIEDWTHHAPREHSAELQFARETEVELRVEHFELTGYAVLTLDIERVQEQ